MAIDAGVRSTDDLREFGNNLQQMGEQMYNVMTQAQRRMNYVSEGWRDDKNEEFKVRQGASWDVNFGVEFNGANIVVEKDGKYKVQLVWDGAQGGTVTLIPAE